ncbi:MAG: rubredoxin [bacterium]
MSKYRCSDCGWIYDEEKGDPKRGIAPGTLWADVPDDFKCANCSNRKKTHKWKKLD